MMGGAARGRKRGGLGASGGGAAKVPKADGAAAAGAAGNGDATKDDEDDDDGDGDGDDDGDDGDKERGGGASVGEDAGVGLEVQFVEEVVWAKAGPHDPWWPAYFATPSDEQRREPVLPHCRY